MIGGFSIGAAVVAGQPVFGRTVFGHGYGGDMFTFQAAQGGDRARSRSRGGDYGLAEDDPTAGRGVGGDRASGGSVTGGDYPAGRGTGGDRPTGG